MANFRMNDEPHGTIGLFGEGVAKATDAALAGDGLKVMKGAKTGREVMDDATPHGLGGRTTFDLKVGKARGAELAQAIRFATGQGAVGPGQSASPHPAASDARSDGQAGPPVHFDPTGTAVVKAMHDRLFQAFREAEGRDPGPADSQFWEAYNQVAEENGGEISKSEPMSKADRIGEKLRKRLAEGPSEDEPAWIEGLLQREGHR